MVARDQIVKTVRRYIGDLEARIETQEALIEKLTAAGRDTGLAVRTLGALSKTLALTREHLAFEISMQARRRPLDDAATSPGS
jgi:hypothetical protein